MLRTLTVRLPWSGDSMKYDEWNLQSRPIWLLRYLPLASGSFWPLDSSP